MTKKKQISLNPPANESERLKRAIQKSQDEIQREANHYNTGVTADIAKGMYFALEIIEKNIREAS